MPVQVWSSLGGQILLLFVACRAATLENTREDPLSRGKLAGQRGRVRDTSVQLSISKSRSASPWYTIGMKTMHDNLCPLHNQARAVTRRTWWPGSMPAVLSVPLHSHSHVFRDVPGCYPDSGRMGSCISQREGGSERGGVGHTRVCACEGGRMDLTAR